MLFQIALEARDENLAQASLQTLKNINVEKHGELKNILEKYITKNTHSKNISDLKNHETYQKDFRYRMLIATFKFIDKYYFPLKFYYFRY